MHKEKKEHMSFYDLFIMDHFVEPYTSFFRETLGFTPNGITWLSNISSLISLIFLWNKNLLLFFVFWHKLLPKWMDMLVDLASDYGDVLDQWIFVRSFYCNDIV